MLVKHEYLIVCTTMEVAYLLLSAVELLFSTSSTAFPQGFHNVSTRFPQVPQAFHNFHSCAFVESLLIGHLLTM